MTAPHMTPRTTLPRRANTIRAVAATMAHKKLIAVNAHQAVVDRIGYIVALVIGAYAFRYFGWPVVEGLAALYGVSAWFAYRRYRKLKDQ